MWFHYGSLILSFPHNPLAGCDYILRGNRRGMGGSGIHTINILMYITIAFYQTFTFYNSLRLNTLDPVAQ